MAVDPVTQGIRRGAAVFGFLKAWRMNRRERRKAKKTGQAVPVEKVEVSMLPKGTQTLTGIAILALVPWAAKYGISSEEVTTWVTAAATLVGGVFAVFGYLRRKKLPAE